MKASRPLRILMAASLAASTAPLFAQTGEAEEESGRIVTVGGGAILQPRFPGARELEFRPWPILGTRRAGTAERFSAPDDSFGLALMKGGNFSLGPAANIASGREEEDAIKGIGNVGTTVEVGAFAEAYMTDNLRFRAEARKGIGGHEGLIGDLGADYIIGDPAKGSFFSIGPRLRLADARYHRAFYGVSPAQRAATGLALHDPDAGLHSAGALVSARVPLGGQLGLRAYGRYDRLLGDAADSPLVRSGVGSRNQFEAGIGLAYNFRL